MEHSISTGYCAIIQTIVYGGIHGIGVLISDKIFNFVSVLSNVKSETVLWLKISEKAFGYSFILGAVYVPPEHSIVF